MYSRCYKTKHDHQWLITGTHCNSYFSLCASLALIACATYQRKNGGGRGRICGGSNKLSTANFGPFGCCSLKTRTDQDNIQHSLFNGRVLRLKDQVDKAQKSSARCKGTHLHLVFARHAPLSLILIRRRRSGSCWVCCAGRLSRSHNRQFQHPMIPCQRSMIYMISLGLQAQLSSLYGNTLNLLKQPPTR